MGGIRLNSCYASSNYKAALGAEPRKILSNKETKEGFHKSWNPALQHVVVINFVDVEYAGATSAAGHFDRQTARIWFYPDPYVNSV